MHKFACLLGVLAAVTLFGCNRPAPTIPPAPAKQEGQKAAQTPAPPPATPIEEKLKLKEYRGVYGVRNAAERPGTQNDLKQVGVAYLTEASGGSAPTTEAAFKAMLKSMPQVLAKKFDEGVYGMNMKGRKLQPHEILAFEWEASSPAGHCVVRANGEIDPNVPREQMIKELGESK